MIRLTTELLTVTVVLTALLFGTPLHAAPFAWASSTGTATNTCAATQPCGNIFDALGATDTGGEVHCLNSPGFTTGDISTSRSVTVDCVGSFNLFGGTPQLTLNGTSQTFKVRNLTFTGNGGGSPTAIQVTGSGTLILENCVFENFTGTALNIEPNGPLTLVIKNSRISNNVGGVLIKPASGGSVTATFDGDTIMNNTGGLRTDSTNGAVRVDVSNSTISNNTANGMVIIGGAGGTNIVNLSHDVIASNGIVGVQVSGANGGVVVDTTLFDENASGATASVSGGHLSTYGNNRIIGPPGSGFIQTLPLQ
jgi:Right handed beta helix region